MSHDKMCKEINAHNIQSLKRGFASLALNLVMNAHESKSVALVHNRK